MQFALGTSIASVSINTFVSMITHHRLKNTLVNVLPTLTISCGIGSLSGSYLTKFFSNDFLRILFGFFEITIALALFFQKSNEHGESHRMPKGIKLFSLGFVISLLSSILGIGGGVIMIPVMVYFFVPMKKAIGTASITSFVTAFLGTLAYIAAGVDLPNTSKTFGFIYLPAFFAIAIGGLISTPIGALMTKRVPVPTIKKILSFLIGTIGLLILINN